MTPAEIIEAARQFSNNTGSNFVTDAELLNYISFGLKECTGRIDLIETTDTSLTSVANQQDYTMPTTVFKPKRIEYDSQPLRPGSFTEMDKINPVIQSSTSTGTPRHYVIFGQTLSLYPKPDTSSLQIKIFHYKIHGALATTSSTIEIPDTFHPYLIDYVVYRIFLKESDSTRAKNHFELWNQHIEEMKKLMANRRVKDNYKLVQTEELSLANTLGMI